ncbi:FAD-dependent monooxygenase [Streptomyces iconiensis]|uniref:FAD-dependent monooxygenase n=1 Tax=Streptomyces iconiensis TaxID=1384038 RepID=A0ABT6ZX39_9ACTN|nr:FAD-dependent monooxygenase [Streptomyces iconiensis]MDJ1133637.1 FAD-dependent monooxygenase [Streptomyces iconiensis]
MGGGSVAVVGGSIAGCAVALAVARGGAERVTVFERAAGALQKRGTGVTLHSSRYGELEAAGYVDAAMPWGELRRRVWTVRDGEAPLGRAIAAQPFPFRAYAWGSLWRELRRRVPESVVYRPDAAVCALEPDADGVTVQLAGGERERFDAVVGADGYRSVVRETMFPGLLPEYSGYLGWRGSSPAPWGRGPRGAGRDGTAAESASVTGVTDVMDAMDVAGAADVAAAGGAVDVMDARTVVFPGGHCVMYRIPGAGHGDPLNWVLYTVPPQLPGPQQDLRTPVSLPPGALAPELTGYLRDLVARNFPPYWAECVLRTPVESTLIQPIYDLEVPHYAAGRLLLAGDAATVARPHIGGGSVKALQDAWSLETAWRAGGDWREVLDAYDADRTAVGATLVGLGRRLGRAQVEETPDWSAMREADLEAWWQEQHRGSDRTSGFGGHAVSR